MEKIKTIDEFVTGGNTEYGSAIVEMATFGEEKWGNNTYKISIHGAMSADRPTPHIHIYYKQEKNTRNPVFNFEISLIDILCKDEINLIYQRDKDKNIERTNRAECGWKGYDDIKSGFKVFLFSTPKPSKFGTFKDNLERAIYEWNRESDYSATQNGENTLNKYFKEHGLVVLPKYSSYLEDYTE